MVFTAAGLGLWLAALAVQYRGRQLRHHVRHAASDVCGAGRYPVSLVPADLQMLYAVNPMVGVIEGFRAALLETRPVPWDFIAIGGVTALIVAVSGAFYFRRKEQIFADVA
jgi:lipopolysaccharide transport system permease protein